MDVGCQRGHSVLASAMALRAIERGVHALPIAGGVERERPELLARLRGWLAGHEEIQQVFYVTGEADFILVIAARDTEAFEQLMAGLVADNANVRRFTTSVALSTPKRSLFVPVAIDTE